MVAVLVYYCTAVTLWRSAGDLRAASWELLPGEVEEEEVLATPMATPARARASSESKRLPVVVILACSVFGPVCCVCIGNMKQLCAADSRCRARRNTV